MCCKLRARQTDGSGLARGEGNRGAGRGRVPVLGESATAYTFANKWGGSFPSRNPRHFLTVKVLECGGEELGLESVKWLKFGALLRAHPP